MMSSGYIMQKILKNNPTLSIANDDYKSRNDAPVCRDLLGGECKYDAIQDVT